MLSRAFVHDANQCLHVIRLAAETLALESGDGRLDPERLHKRVDVILSQVEHLTALIGGVAAPPAAMAAFSPAVPTAAGQAQSPPLVLVVEDEVLSALMLADHLQQGGYEVHVAHDGEEAVGLCRHTIFDAIVTDIRMPRMDGVELLKHLEELQPETPVVVVSGHLAADQAATLPDSVIDVVRKPFPPSRIADTLAKVLHAPQLDGGC